MSIREVIINPRRMSGNTTRLADAYIQDIFNGATVKIRDIPDQQNLHKRLFFIIIRRLELEHGLQSTSSEFTINKHDLTIQWNLANQK